MRTGIFICLVLSACLARHIEPENKISDSTMVNIMTDLYALNAAFAETFGTVKDSISSVYMKQIEKQYSITKAQLEENLEYLRSDPVKLDSIFNQILRKIDELESDISE